MMDTSVCFSGYRPSKYHFSTELKKITYQKMILEISTCIRYGFNVYYFGGAPGFDLLAAYAVIYLKKVFDIKLICALPYEKFYLSNEFDENWRNDYLTVIKKCDEILNISGKTEKDGDSYM